VIKTSQVLSAEIFTSETKIHLNLQQQFKNCLQLKSVIFAKYLQFDI